LILLASAAPALFAKDYLTVTSDPPGATVEIDGMVVGKTPYTIEIPGAYLRGTGNVFGLHHLLRQQMHLRVTLDGYLAKEADLARGPYHWIANNGVYHGDYWLLRAATFNVALEKAATAFTGSVHANLSGSIASMRPALPPEQIFRVANPAVLYLRSSEGSGSGFLITDTGIAVTNAHVARGQSTLTARTGNGQNFNAKVEYIDQKLDIALLRVEGTNFPHLSLADLSTVQPGSSVIAIGSPSQGFENTITKGIVSAIGPMPNEPGTWIQTDAAINPGNSGGPLLNSSGEVVGINTQKPFVSSDGRPLQGIGFALSGSDLLTVLQRFFPTISQLPATNPAEDKNTESGKVTISADVENADVYVDGKFVGNVPSTLTLSAGAHKIEVKAPDRTSWERDLEVMNDSSVNLKAVLPNAH